ncbi:MAG TPA: carboxypeptidase-like regulatory domain-containing protein [Pyrinomonadaceae bacterium]|nr:carboxypeptidase-like regulatory domain-containing protein [Pyrinomonadaceae bacterium]
MMIKAGFRALLFLLCAGLWAGAYAQTSTVGSISGTLRDQQGAAVPNVEVVVTEQTTGQSRTVRTNGDGFFTVPSLPVGRYNLTASPQGFKRVVAPDLVVNVSSRVVLDLTLEVGEVTEVVTVEGAAQLVETRTQTVSSLISEKQVTELPLNGRNYAQLALMVPGVSPVTQSGAGGAFAAGGTGLNAGVDMSVNGNQSNANMWTVDGVNNMDVGSNRTLLVFPSIDSIQEFRVERNSFSAEFGQAQGAVVNLVTKGGGNQFHGTLFEFFRHDSLNANSFFLNRAGQERAPLSYHNFGGNLSGPVYLPRFGEGGKPYWSGKNRVFFFWSEEWRRERRGFTVGGRVPTAAEKRGDFSGPLTGPLPVDPATCNPGPCQPFPGNRIPENRLSPAGLSLLRIYPDPNTPNPTGPGNNWAASPLQPIDTRQDLIRFDANITDRMNVMVRYINEKWVHSQASGNFWGDTPFPTLSSDWEQPSRSFAVKLTNTLSSTAVNDFQFSRSGNDIFVVTSAQSRALFDDIASKFPTVFPGNESRVPSLFWGPGGYADLWHQAPWENHQDLNIWKDDFSKVLGSHELKLGVLYSHNSKEEPGNGAGGGNQPLAINGCGGQTGNCIADLLLRDLPLANYVELSETQVGDGRWRDFEFYVNDTWKVHQRLTFTLGMRYSRFPSAWAEDDRITNFLPRLYNGTFESMIVTPQNAAQHGLPRSLVKTYKMGFQPRVGLAWDVFGDGKTAVRVGFGRYMSRANVIEDLLRMTNNPPWTTTVDTGWGGSGRGATLADCPTCRSMDTINPGLRNSVVGVNPSAGVNAVSEDFRPPESYQWNLSVSREVMPDTVLEASYIGNRGLHIWRRNVPFNDVPPGPARLAIAQAVRNGQSTDALVNANRRLGPNSPPISMSESTGNSYYHAMQLWLNRRFAQNLAFQASYTWGHTISDVPLTSFTNYASDPFDYRDARGDADLDRRHTFVGNVVYVLPRLRSWGPVAEHVLGDWQLNGIFSYFGSTPIDITSGVNTLGTSSNTGQRPDLVPGVPIYLDGADSTLHLNPAAFRLPAVGRNGNLGRGAIRGTPLTTLDFSLNKNWRVRERAGLQFRAEFFNLLNHANFNGFNTGLAFQGNFNDPNFGRITNGGFGTLNSTQRPREIQFGVKMSF